MKTVFEVDGYTYIMEFTDLSEFVFYIDTEKSKSYRPQFSEFEKAFGEEPPKLIFTQTNIKNFFRVKFHIMKFIDAVLKKHKPYYFTYSANEYIKKSLYARFALYIAKKYCYNINEDISGSKFVFRKQLNGKLSQLSEVNS